MKIVTNETLEQMLDTILKIGEDMDTLRHLLLSILESPSKEDGEINEQLDRWCRC